jgi:hypothetical protein
VVEAEGLEAKDPNGERISHAFLWLLDDFVPNSPAWWSLKVNRQINC